jgi:CDP-glycerol glycerophosphotransferase (TagB/SpsB family)
MGAAAGMVSDYSSAWVDFLGLRRSVGLYCPDLPRYAADRGFNDPPLDVVAAGLFLRTAGDLDEFFGAIAAGSVWREAELTACADALEVRDARPATGRSRTGELLDAVREAGLARHGHDFNLHPPA